MSSWSVNNQRNGCNYMTQSSPCLAVNFSSFLWAFVQACTDLVVGLNLAKAGGVLIATTEQPFGLCEMDVVKVPSARQTFIHWECIKKVFINWSLCWHLWQSSQKLSMNRHCVRGWDLLASLSKKWYLLHILWAGAKEFPPKNRLALNLLRWFYFFFKAGKCNKNPASVRS